MARLYLVTANIGSVFDNLDHGLPIWLNEFASSVRSRDPEFVAIHFQETGGKDCPNTTDSVERFFRQLVSCMEQLNFRVAEGFIDTRSDLKDQYTALSSIYFVHESLRLPVHIWDFQDAKFHEISTAQTQSSSGNSILHPNVHMGLKLDQSFHKQKEKFPQHFYPNCKWSRKGFLRTRWRFGKTVVDLVNIHLFHDSDNLTAASAFPSPFAQHREKTLKYTLNRIQSDDLDNCPLFIFGDFNFRINAFGVMDLLRKDFDRGTESEITFATKKFNCPEQEQRFLHSYEWLKQHDFECKQYSGLLQEFDLNFHPTYPFDEDIDKPEMFMRTRLPAWCDRVLFTPFTKDIIIKDFPTEYNLIGSKVCMGDHKPVSLSLKIRTDIYLPTSTTNCREAEPTPINDSLIKGKSKSEFVAWTSNEIVELDRIPSTTSHASALASRSIYCDAVEIYGDCVDKTPASYNSGGGDELTEFPPGMESLTSSSYIPANKDNLERSEERRKPGCKCFSNALFRFRGRLKLSQGSSVAGNRSKTYFGFKAFSKYKRGGGGKSFGSLLEPIAYAACEPPISSLPSSALPSQRPSFHDGVEATLTDRISSQDAVTSLLSSDNIDFFTVPPPSIQNGKEMWKGRKCSGCCAPIQLPKDHYCCSNGNCKSQMVMMNITTMITSSRNNSSGEVIPLGSNLNLIALNNEMEKGNKGLVESDPINGKIPVCWATSYSCADCMNTKNLQSSLYNHDKNTKAPSNGLSTFSFRGRSASQGSGTVQTYKCHLKEGMSKTTTAAGDCFSCSKCVIL